MMLSSVLVVLLFLSTISEAGASCSSSYTVLPNEDNPISCEFNINTFVYCNSTVSLVMSCHKCIWNNECLTTCIQDIWFHPVIINLVLYYANVSCVNVFVYSLNTDGFSINEQGQVDDESFTGIDINGTDYSRFLEIHCNSSVEGNTFKRTCYLDRSIASNSNFSCVIDDIISPDPPTGNLDATMFYCQIMENFFPVSQNFLIGLVYHLLHYHLFNSLYLKLHT